MNALVVAATCLTSPLVVCTAGRSEEMRKDKKSHQATDNALGNASTTEAKRKASCDTSHMGKRPKLASSARWETAIQLLLRSISHLDSVQDSVLSCADPLLGHGQGRKLPPRLKIHISQAKVPPQSIASESGSLTMGRYARSSNTTSPIPSRIRLAEILVGDCRGVGI